MERKYQETLIRFEGPIKVEVDLETQELLRDSKIEIDKLTDLKRKYSYTYGSDYLCTRISAELDVMEKLRNKFEQLIIKNSKNFWDINH